MCMWSWCLGCGAGEPRWEPPSKAWKASSDVASVTTVWSLFYSWMAQGQKDLLYTLEKLLTTSDTLVAEAQYVGFNI